MSFRGLCAPSLIYLNPESVNSISKIALVTDTHFGARLDNKAFHDHFATFFSKVFFPELKKRGIQTVLHGGDLVDKRNSINFETARRLKEDFLDPLQAIPEVHMIAGNHDVYYKNSNEVNALSTLLSGYHYTFSTEPEDITLADGFGILCLPWINNTNYDKTMEIIDNSKNDTILGHLAINGCEMHAGQFEIAGLDQKLFSRFNKVWTGHFHHPSVTENIHYLGAPYDWNWADYDDRRGFHILETQTGDIEFIHNPYTLFARYVYDDRKLSLEQIQGFDFSPFQGKYVKLVVLEKTQPYWYDIFLTGLARASLDLKVIEAKYSMVDTGEEEPRSANTKFETENTLKLVNRVVNDDELLTERQKQNVTRLFSTLYTQAINTVITQ